MVRASDGPGGLVPLDPTVGERFGVRGCEKFVEGSRYQRQRGRASWICGSLRFPACSDTPVPLNPSIECRTTQVARADIGRPLHLAPIPLAKEDVGLHVEARVLRLEDLHLGSTF